MSGKTRFNPRTGSVEFVPCPCPADGGDSGEGDVVVYGPLQVDGIIVVNGILTLR